MKLPQALKIRLKWILYPGVNLHGRLRYSRIPRLFDRNPSGTQRFVLDAGCGNGMLTYRSYTKGNSVVGVTFKEEEVRGCKALFNDYLGIPEERLRFNQGNLYSLDFPDGCFDEIICSEVLEHLLQDSKVCESFWRLLRPGGILHVCAPNADHPYNKAFPLDPLERGGHVRAGYTMQSYKELLEPLGFELDKSIGLGGPIRQAFNWRIKETQKKWGVAAGLPLFAVSLPAMWLERSEIELESAFSIYIRAIKPTASSATV